MKCPKCQGLMVYEHFHDFQDDTGKMSFTGWRCVSCGRISDPLIEAHQRKRIPVLSSRARRSVVKL